MMAGFDLHGFCARCRDKKKGKDPYVEKPGSDCQHCKALTPEQLMQLSTPSYKLKKEKRDKADTTPSKNTSSTKVTLSPTLVDPARVLVMRAVDGQDTGLSAQPAEKKKKVEDKKKSFKSKPSASASRLAAVSTDQRFDELDQKWSDRFNRLEALLLARTLDQPQQEPTFGAVKVVPAHSPPASVIRSEPFIRPTDQPASQAADRPSGPTDRPSTSTATDPPTSRSQADRQQLSDRPAASDRPSTSISHAFQPTRKISSSESDSDSVVSDRPLLIFLLRRESCRMNWMLQLQIQIIPLRKNNLTILSMLETDLVGSGSHQPVV